MENRVSWLLIDVEGHEVSVLNGARNILQKFHPRIIIEVQPVNFDKVNTFLAREGYSITRINSIYYYAKKAD